MISNQPWTRPIPSPHSNHNMNAYLPGKMQLRHNTCYSPQTPNASEGQRFLTMTPETSRPRESTWIPQPPEFL